MTVEKFKEALTANSEKRDDIVFFYNGAKLSVRDFQRVAGVLQVILK